MTVAAFPELPEVRFVVPGKPEPQGSARMVPLFHQAPCPRCHRRDQRITSDNRRLGPWRRAIRRALGAEELRPISGPVRVSLAFALERPKAHRGAKGLKASAPAYPTGRPDLDKLTRAVLDALSTKAFTDDAQVVELLVLKHYATPGHPGVDIRIEALA